MTVDMNSIEHLVTTLITFGPRAQYGHSIAGLSERQSFFPDSRIERNRRVFNDDKYLFVHKKEGVLLKALDKAQPTRKAWSLAPNAMWASC